MGYLDLFTQQNDGTRVATPQIVDSYTLPQEIIEFSKLYPELPMDQVAQKYYEYQSKKPSLDQGKEKTPYDKEQSTIKQKQSEVQEKEIEKAENTQKALKEVDGMMKFISPSNYVELFSGKDLNAGQEFAADILLDPTSYASFGLLPFVKNIGPKAQRVALPHLIARQLNKNIDNTILPSEKTVRLYRGTGTNGPISSDGGTQQAGKWFTPIKTKTGAYLEDQQAYARRKGINNPTYLEYVDIPESQLEHYRAARTLDPKKVEFEKHEDYLIPLDIKRNKIEIPHFTNSQERLDLHLGKSLPETPFNPSNTQWDISKHIYYNEDPTKTSGLFLDFIDHSDEFISAKALNKLTKDNNYYFRQETYLDPIENIDILQNNKTNKQLLFKDGSMFNYQFPNDKQVLYRIPKQNIQLKEIPQKPGIYYYDQGSINMNDVKGDILEWDDVAKMYKITQYRKLGGKLNYLDLFKNNFQK